MSVSPEATPAKRPRKKPEAKSEPKFQCEFCKRSFASEKTIFAHICEPKRRWHDQDQKHVKLAFKVFQTFYKLNMQGKKEKTYRDFMESQFYIAFVKFGKYLLNMNAINPMGFVEFLCKMNVPIAKWESPVVYETYVRELNKKETAEKAMERNILLMQQWAEENGEHWTDFFRKVAPAQATLWIRSGRISPWILFTAASASEFLGRLSDEQLMLVQENIDPEFWRIKLERHQEDVEFIRQCLDEAGV